MYTTHNTVTLNYTSTVCIPNSDNTFLCSSENDRDWNVWHNLPTERTTAKSRIDVQIPEHRFPYNHTNRNLFITFPQSNNTSKRLQTTVSIVSIQTKTTKNSVVHYHVMATLKSFGNVKNMNHRNAQIAAVSSLLCDSVVMRHCPLVHLTLLCWCRGRTWTFDGHAIKWTPYPTMVNESTLR